MRMNRRMFLGTALAAGAAFAQDAAPALPRVDLHVHLDNSTLEKVLALSGERDVKFGIVEHAGDAENVYPVVLKNDEELRGRIAMLAGKPVFKGIQAEWSNWMSCFSKEALLELDYVLTDAMTMPGPDGKRMKLWEAKEEALGTAETFMDRYVEWHVEVLTKQPVDILANVSWLPAPFAKDYETLWTEARVAKLIEPALKYGVAIELSSGFKLPQQRFAQQVKEAGCLFSFGSNGRYPKMGEIEYSLILAHELKMERKDIFVPGDRPKAVERRWK